jgi:hypothetical protein
MATRSLSFRVLFLLVSACAGQEGQQYFPQPRDQERWEYALEYATGLGGVQKASAVTRVDGREVIGGREYYKIVTVVSGIPGVEPEITYLRWTGSGIYAVDGKHKDKPEFLTTPFPVAVGDTWTALGHARTSFARVDGIGPVELFDRKYDDCLALSYTVTEGSTRYTVTDYVAKGIGSVKIIVKVRGVTMEYVLQKHDR